MMLPVVVWFKFTVIIQIIVLIIQMQVISCQLCPEIKAPLYGSLLKECGRNYLDTCYITCPNGYYLMGSSFRVCDTSGQWTGTDVKCLDKGISCPAIEKIRGGKISINCLPYAGGKCSYTCYADNSTQEITCTDQGKWDSEPNKCPDAPEPVVSGPCGPLFPPVGGSFLSLKCSGFIGETCTVTCDFGYKIQGASSLLCKPDTRWSAKIPICVPSTPQVDLKEYFCKNLNPPVNGYAEGVCVGATTGQSCLFNCFTGYSLRGLPSLKCLGNGSWDGPAPICEPAICDSLTPPPHGLFKGICIPGIVFESCTLICESGYTAVVKKLPPASALNITCQPDGTWTDMFPRCDPITCRRINQPQEFPNGIMTGDCTPGIGDHFCSFSCNTGYALVGNSTIVCQVDSSWSHPVPSCISISCAPQKLPPGIAASPAECSFTVPVGFSCKFSCSCGSVGGFPEISKCGASGTWSSPPPFCQPYTCPPPDIKYGFTTGTCTPGICGQECSINCFPGYTLPQGASPVLTCGVNGSWSQNPVPQCIPVPVKVCQPIGPPSNGLFVPPKDVCTGPVGTTCRVACKTCNDLKGGSMIQCESNGMWSPPPDMMPKCVPSPKCPMVMAPVNGMIESCNNNCDGSCSFRCNPGFMANQPTVIRCNPPQTSANTPPDVIFTSFWSGPVPFCVSTGCPAVFAPEGGIWMGQRCPPTDPSCDLLVCPATSGSSCRLVCGKGFKLSDPGRPAVISCVTSPNGVLEWQPNPNSIKCWREGP